MKNIKLPTYSVIFLLVSAFTLAKKWKIDSENSKISFELPAQNKKGTFGNLNATINFDKKNLSESKITASIDVNTIKEGNEKHETHLLSSDFFDAGKFPKISFTSTEIITLGGTYIAKGNLTMKDSIKPIEIPFTFNENGKNQAIFSGTITINASDYGVMKKNKEGADKVIVYLVVPVSEL